MIYITNNIDLDHIDFYKAILNLQGRLKENEQLIFD